MTAPISPSLPPVGGSGPSLGPAPLTSPSTFKTDGQSAYSADIAAGTEITIKDFSQIVLSATNDSNETLWSTQQFNASRRKDFYLALVLDGLLALELLEQRVSGAQSFKTSISDNQVFVDSLNSNIQDYNTNTVAIVQPGIDTLNQAIDQYNNGTINMDQLNDAIDFYNNEVSTYFNGLLDQVNSEISDFNNQAAIFNQTVDLLNAARSPGTDPYVGQDLYTATPAPMPVLDHITGTETNPIPDVSFTPTILPYTSNTMSPSSANVDLLIQTLNTDYDNLLNNQLALSTAILQSQSNHQGFVQFYLQGIIATLPPSFYTPSLTPNLSTGASNSAGGAGGPGSGVSLSTIIASLSNPMTNAIIEQSIFSADMQEQSLPLTPAAITQLQFSSLSLLSNIGLQSGSLALRLLADRLAFIDVRSSPVAVALGLTLASEIALGISSGAIANGVKGIIESAYPGLDPAKKEALASQLTAAQELVLLQAALFQLAQALKAPLLTAQVLGTLPSVESLGLTSTSAANVNTEALKSALANNLASQLNISSTETTALLSDSLISAATQDPFNNQAIIDELVQKEIPLQTAIKAANYAKAYVQAEIQSQSLLDTPLSPERLNQSILSNQLVAQLTQNNPTITNRELRDLLAQQFANSGNTPENALLAATLAVTGNGGISPTNSDALRGSLLQTATAGLAGLGNSSSVTNNIANQLVSTVLGPTLPGSQASLRELIDERLQILLNSRDKNIVDAMKANLTTFLEPTVELYSFADALRDPANTFLLCAQTGLMYSHPQPSNYIKSVDIIV